MGKLLGHLETFLKNQNLAPLWSKALSITVMGLGVVILAALAWIIASTLEKKILKTIVRKTRSDWDDELLEKGVFGHLMRVVPLAVIWILAPSALVDLPVFLGLVRALAILLMILLVTMAVINILSAVNSLYSRREDAKRRPIKGIIQAVQVLIIAAAVILIFSIVMNKPVSGLMAGLGAISAVLMLVFKDPLMGLVSGFQISSNDMVRIGDWVEVPSAGADGDVIDINLLNVTVRNWDKTYVTFPIQNLTTGGLRTGGA